MAYRLLLSHPARPSKRAAKFPAWADVTEIPFPLLSCSFGQLVMAVSFITNVEPLVRAPPAPSLEASAARVADAVAREGGVGAGSGPSSSDHGEMPHHGMPGGAGTGTATATATATGSRSAAGSSLAGSSEARGPASVGRPPESVGHQATPGP